MHNTFLCRITVCTAAASALLFGGCATTDTKTIALNSDAVLAQSFTPAQLPAPVRALIDQGEPLPKLFQRIEYKHVAERDEQGVISQITGSTALVNLGNGYVQVRTEYARNEVPYRINLVLSFAGMYRLRTQATFLNSARSDVPYEVKEMKRFDRAMARPRTGTTYVVESKSGTAPQFLNFFQENWTCVAGATSPASDVAPAFTGTATAMDCTTVGENGVVVAKNRYMWLADYGIGIQTEITDSRSKSVSKVTAVEIVR